MKRPAQGLWVEDGGAGEGPCAGASSAGSGAPLGTRSVTQAFAALACRQRFGALLSRSISAHGSARPTTGAAPSIAASTAWAAACPIS